MVNYMGCTMEYNMNHKCPVCSKHMKPFPRGKKSIDYICSDGIEHHYSERIEKGKVIIFKLRIGDDPSDKRLYLKVDIANHNSEIWQGVDSQKRIKIDDVITMHPSLEKMKNKIQTLIVFS